MLPFTLFPDTLQVAGAVFTKDFGPWKAGHRAQTIVIDFTVGIMTEYDDKDERVHVAKISLEALEVLK
jgi:hypothetical protein